VTTLATLLAEALHAEFCGCDVSVTGGGAGECIDTFDALALATEQAKAVAAWIEADEQVETVTRASFRGETHPAYLSPDSDAMRESRRLLAALARSAGGA
jgi:hypothetical protein